MWVENVHGELVNLGQADMCLYMAGSLLEEFTSNGMNGNGERPEGIYAQFGADNIAPIVTAQYLIDKGKIDSDDDTVEIFFSYILPTITHYLADINTRLVTVEQIVEKALSRSPYSG